MHYSISRDKTLKSFYVYDGNVLQMWTDMSVFEKSARKAQLLMNIMDHILLSAYKNPRRDICHTSFIFLCRCCKKSADVWQRLSFTIPKIVNSEFRKVNP